MFPSLEDYWSSDLPLVEHLYFPLVFSLDGDKEKGTGTWKVRYDSVCSQKGTTTTYELLIT